MDRITQKRWQRRWRSWIHQIKALAVARAVLLLALLTTIGYFFSNSNSSQLVLTTKVESELEETHQEMESSKIEIRDEREEKPPNVRTKLNRKRQERIKSAFVHAFEGYERYAFGFDEVRPVSNQTNSSWGALGVTIFDALDTMILMNLEEAYLKSRDWVLKVDFDKDHDASFFEFTIRYVGGLLGAYELTRDFAFLEKAKDMADRLLWAFNSTTGIPYSIVNLKTHKARNPSWSRSSSVLSEFGSVQLEFRYLSRHLGDPIYEEKAQRVMEILQSIEKKDGMYPVYLDPETGKFQTGLVSYGGLGDSFYEYLIKQYILSGKVDSRAHQMYLESIGGLMKRMMVRSKPTGMLFVGEYDLNIPRIIPEMDHLVCYVPGMLALGAAESQNPKIWMNAAVALAETCYKLYEVQPTGLGPERVEFQITDASSRDFRIIQARYLLRPETIESLFVLWRITQNETYREWGWSIFEAIEMFCKTPTAFSGLEDVSSAKPIWNNSMQSFFFAETLKYLWLLFAENDILPLNKYVLTTEAHPLGIFHERHNQ